MKKNLLRILLLLSFFSPFLTKAQINLQDNGVAVTENFTSLGTSATATLPANWKVTAPGATPVTYAAVGNFTATTQQASSAAPTAGGRYNWGINATERAIGFMTSGSYASPSSIMVAYTNANAANLIKLDVTYNIERYRVNTANASVQFFYSLDGTNWTAVAAGDVSNAELPTAASAYNFVTPLTIAKSVSISSLNIAPASLVYLRWNVNTTGTNSQGIGLDDVSVTPTFVSATAPTILTNPTSVPFGNQAVSTTSSSQSIVLTYSNLDGTDVNLTVADPFTISKTNGGTYSNSLTYTSAELGGTTTTIYAKFAPTTAATSNNNLSISGGGLAAPVLVAFSGTGTMGDVSPPVNTTNYPKIANITTTTADLVHNINENGTTYYVVLSTGGVAPTTPSQVKLGQDGNSANATKFGSFSNTANSDATANLTGLNPNTLYNVYLVSEDAVPNLQSSVTNISFTTAAGPLVASSIIISQYYEGTSTNKWIELTNLSNVAVNTATPQLKLALYNISGSTGNINITGSPSQIVDLNITIPPKGSVLIGNSLNSNEIPYLTAASANQTSNTVINFNGNDGVALLDASNNIIDAFGQGINAADVSYVRNIDVVAENPTFTLGEWTSVSIATVQNAIDDDDLNQLGVHFPPNLPACSAPTVAATNLVFSNLTTTGFTGTFTKSTDASEHLIIRSLNNTLNATPTDGVVYTVGASFGGGTIVTKTANDNFTEAALANSTTYYYYIIPYNSTSCTGGPKYLTTSILTGTETTKTPLPCATPTDQATTFNITASNYNFVQAAFTLASNVDEYLVVMSTSSSLNANPTNQLVYNVGDALGGGIIVKRGGGNTFVKNGLTPNTDYYFFVFSVNSSCTGGPLYLTTAPLTGHYKTGILDLNNLNFYYGNLHAHSSDSDGNKEDTNKTPADDYAFAKNSLNMDFLGLSEHNHTQAGMLISKWQPGINAAHAATTSTFLAIHGTEWGVISGGGHVVVYGIDSLIGWEPNQYQIYVPKSTYIGPTGLFRILNRHGLNAFGTLAHPNSADYNNLSNIYDLGADSAIVGVALESGPASSHNLTYSDPGSSMSYQGYYNKMLAKGYHLGATIDHDNHYLTFGRHTSARLVVLAPSLTEDDILDAMKKMRFYASEDPTAKVTYKINGNPVGSILKNAGAPIVSITSVTTTPVTSIKLWYGTPGSGANPVMVASSTDGTLNYVHNGLTNSATGYYYADFTETDGTRIITSPIWYTRDDALPIHLTTFSATAMGNYVSLKWATASETNNNYFTIERSTDGKSFTALKQVKGAGNSNQLLNYSSTDENPLQGVNYYRIKQTDFDGTTTYSDIKAANILSAKENTLKVYPNPVVDHVTLDLPTSSNSVNLTVSGVDGKLIFSATGSIDNLNEKLNARLNRFTTGVYILKVTANGQSYTNKMIKQ